MNLNLEVDGVMVGLFAEETLTGDFLLTLHLFKLVIHPINRW
jgi:hypothetical protein